MCRFTHNSLFRNLFLFCLISALLGCATSQFSRRATNVGASPSPTTTAETPQDQSDAITRPTSKPYTGELSIFEDPKRDEKLQPDRIMDHLGIKEGSNVADIGAGSGWFTVRAARRVGNGGIVYAVDINRDYLDYIENRSKRENFANIRVILGKDDDPLLPAKSVDAVRKKAAAIFMRAIYRPSPAVAAIPALPAGSQQSEDTGGDDRVEDPHRLIDGDEDGRHTRSRKEHDLALLVSCSGLHSCPPVLGVEVLQCATARRRRDV